MTALTPERDPDGYTDEQVSVMNAQVAVDHARDHLVICVNDMVRRGYDKQEALLAIEGALTELKTEL